MKSQVTYRLSGSALFYALLVAVLMAAFSTALITTSYYHRVITDYEWLETKLIRNTYSGLEILKATKGDLSETELDLHAKGMDSVLLQKYQFGLFEIAISEAFQTTLKGKLNHQKIAILGASPQEDWERSALYLRDGFKPLTLAGQTSLNGTVFLPKSGVKGGYVDGQSFSGEELVNGDKKRSSNQLPLLETRALYERLEQLKYVENASFDEAPDSLQVSFTESTKVFQESVIYIHEQLLRGNMCLIADSLVYISRNSVVEDIIIYAPDIYIEEGFVGNLQAYATRHFEVGRHCHFKYPTVLGVLQLEDSRENAVYTFRENTKVRGMILADDFKKAKPYPAVNIESGCMIEGQIFCNSPLLDLRGNVNGNVTTSGFRLRTSRSQYDNHLLDVDLNISKRSPRYLSPFLQKKRGKVKIVKWGY